jgi:hypothetical protein
MYRVKESLVFSLIREDSIFLQIKVIIPHEELQSLSCKWRSNSASEAEFWDIIGTKVLRVFHPCYSQSHLRDFIPSLSKSGLKLGCNVKILYQNFTKSENAQDYAQKPQWNCMFMNSASVKVRLHGSFLAEDLD